MGVAVDFDQYKCINFDEGQQIFTDGDDGDHALVIVDGIVEVWINSNGERISLQTLGAGDIVGEMALIDEMPRTASVTALTPVTATVITREAMSERMHAADPALELILRSLIERFRRATSRIDEGKRGVHEDVRRRILQASKLQAELMVALTESQFEMHYQPIVSLVDGSVMGFEALIRWRKEGRLVAPFEFIPMLESSGLIVPVGRWLIGEACAALSRIQAGFGDGRARFMSVNVSGIQLDDPELLGVVRTAIAENKLEKGQLKIELTETMLMKDADATAARLQAFCDEGATVAIDDFGTGYSSLAYLHRFPLHTLKIDRSFVDGCENDAQMLQIVRSISTLAQTLGLNIVAEGIENKQQATVLAALGCDYGQGWLYAKAMPEAELGDYLRDDHAND